MPYEDIKNIILEVNEDLLTEALIQVTCIFSFYNSFSQVFLRCCLLEWSCKEIFFYVWIIQSGASSCVDSQRI